MKSFAVLGLGSFGRAVAKSLAARGAEVIGVDLDATIVDEIKDDVGHAIRLDTTDERAMREAGIQDVDVAIVAHGVSLEANILTAVIVRRLGVPTIVARAVSELHAEVLRAVGADRVVSVESELGDQLAESLIAPGIVERVPLAAGQSLVELQPSVEVIGRTLRELDARSRFAVNVVAIRRRRKELDEGGGVSFVEEIDNTPDPDDRIGEHDRLLVVGSDEAVKKFVAEAGAR